MSMAGSGKITDWFIPYEDTRYLGYIEDLRGRKFHVPEDEALSLCDTLNGLTEALADIAERFDPDGTIEERSLCELAYDYLNSLGHLARDKRGDHVPMGD